MGGFPLSLVSSGDARMLEEVMVVTERFCYYGVKSVMS